MLDHIFNILSPDILIIGFAFSVILVLFAGSRPAICFSLAFPSLLFLGALKDFLPLSTSAGTAVFPLAAIIGQVAIRNRFHVRRLGHFEFAIIVLALLIAFSVTYSTNKPYGMDKAVLFAFMVVPTIIFAPQVITSIESLRNVIFVITVSLFTYVIWSTINLMGLGEIAGRVSTLADVTRAGQFLGLASVVFLLGAIFARKIGPKLFSMALAVAGLVLAVATGTRGAMLGVLITLIFAYWFVNADWFARIRRIPATTIALVIFVPMAIAVGAYAVRGAIPESVVSRFSSLHAFFGDFADSEKRDRQSTHSRVFHYNLSYRLFVAHPIRGIGAGSYTNFIREYEGFRFHDVDDKRLRAYPHNLILEFAVEQGIFSLIAILYIQYLCFAMIIRLRRYVHRDSSYLTIITLCVSIYIYGLIVSMISLDVPRMMILWWGMGLLLAVYRIYSHGLLVSSKKSRSGTMARPPVIDVIGNNKRQQHQRPPIRS